MEKHAKRGTPPSLRPAVRDSAESIGRIIGKIAISRGWEERLLAEKARETLLSLIVPAIRIHVASIRVTEKGCCYLKLDSAAARCDLSYSLQELRSETNRQLGTGFLKEIRLG